MQHLHEVHTPEEMRQIAVEIVKNLSGYPIVLLKGELGAGKTTLAQEILRLLGVKEPVTSPTFSLVNEYESTRGTIYHFDLYRLKNVLELDGIGFMQYLDSGKPCLIEWPEIAENNLVDFSTIEVIIHKQDIIRKVELNYHPI